MTHLPWRCAINQNHAMIDRSTDRCLCHLYFVFAFNSIHQNYRAPSARDHIKLNNNFDAKSKPVPMQTTAFDIILLLRVATKCNCLRFKSQQLNIGPWRLNHQIEMTIQYTVVVSLTFLLILKICFSKHHHHSLFGSAEAWSNLTQQHTHKRTKSLNRSAG